MHIVAPAGDVNRFYAAVDAGAEEIYMGLQGLGARKSAKNFTLTEYKAAIDYAHERGSKVLLTLNTVMMDNEFDPLYSNLNALYKAGLDAIIVQDLGMFKFLKENFPEIELHGSTQMTVVNHVEAEYLRELGFKRVVLSRELSFQEIKKIRENTKIELEVFVSGALCVAYSGKCFMSSFIGARSGNRGMCAQPCRKKYEATTGEKGYLLSPKDQLMGQEEIELLKSIGVESIKIEGRMKDEQYVFELVSYYKNLIDGEERKERVSGIFNRGYGKGYFYGDEEIINKDFSSNLGQRIGVVSGKEVELLEAIKFGDGITYVSKTYEKLGGCNLSKISIKRDKIRYRSSDAEKDREAKIGDIVIMIDLPPGTRYIYRTHSKELDDAILRERHSSDKKMVINGDFKCKLGEKPTLIFQYENFRGELIEVIKIGDKEAELASKKGVTSEDVLDKISELGDTNLKMDEKNFKCEIGENLFIPMSIIKTMKRDAAEELEAKIIQSYKRENSDTPKVHIVEHDIEKNPEIIAIVKTDDQSKILKELGVNKVLFSKEQIVTEKNLNKIIKNTGLAYSFLDIIPNKSKEDRNKGVTLHWSFNITNSYTIALLENIKNIESIILSPELSFEKIKRIGKTRIKKALLIYSKPKVMHIETKILSKDSTLINDMGDKFKTIINLDGTTDIYLDRALDITDRMKEVKSLGVDQVVLEFFDESPKEIESIFRGITDVKNSTVESSGYNYWKGVF